MHVLKLAKKEDIDVLFNPAPAVNLLPAAFSITHLVVDETEAAILSGCDEEKLQDMDGLKTVAAGFRDWGANNVVTTLGGRGVIYAEEMGLTGLITTKRVNVVDATAPGDAFIGAYALEAVKPDFKVAVAVEEASGAAAFAVKKKGA
ncbi:Ribokinase-like protein [Bisporella sp. PMI_857]|nr:Ribokinase-like protein [Bisporella sp. PMI_857]